MTFLRERILLLCKVIFALFLGAFAFRILTYHWALINFPYAVALREGAMMRTTDALLRGLNPYDMSLQPQYMNQYGIFYPLLVWPWAKIFGITMIIHRIITAIFILASCALIGLVQAKKKIPLLLNVWGCLMLYASLTYPTTSTPTIDPGATGTFFYLLTILIPWFFEFSYPSLIISVICGILAFYSKAYVFVGTLIMLSYLFLFVSKMKFLFYSVFLCSLFSISIIIINHIMPAYFDNCFFTSANMAPAWASMVRLSEQIHDFEALHKWTLILMTLGLFWYTLKKVLHFNWNLSPKNFKFYCSLELYTIICSSLILYFSLGRHSGAFMWYFFQLLSPFFLIYVTSICSRQSWWPLLCAPFLLLNLNQITLDHKVSNFKDHMANWPEVTTVIREHHEVLNTSLIAPILIEERKDIVDDGQAEYFGSGAMRGYWMKGIFKEDDRVYIQLMRFFQDIRTKVDQKQYDMIILHPDLLPMGVADEIKKNYKCAGGFTLYAPQDERSYSLTVWLPN